MRNEEVKIGLANGHQARLNKRTRSKVQGIFDFPKFMGQCQITCLVLHEAWTDWFQLPIS
ncbi:hypothetical protein BTUL_0114g00040 [Botrytis tulipae]|uniref:Uncharacterized protein n=1 Tax=Botrytis tulipae TaxID=87230 RepID=A0A4Z1EQD8_9HELO|nr:hypothetical protein BTUL_0114g00040 [Botrytis tulipae]